MFKLKISKGTRVKQVDWSILGVSWLEVNIDGATRGYLSNAISGGIFRGNKWKFVGGFTLYLGIKFSIYIEFMVVIIAIETFKMKNYKCVWMWLFFGFSCSPWKLKAH